MSLLEDLRKNRRKTYEAALAVTEPAAAENRQLTDDEQRLYAELSSKLDTFDERIKQVADSEQRTTAAANKLAELRGDDTGTTMVMSLLPSPDVMHALYDAVQGNETRRLEADGGEEQRALVTTTMTGAANITSELSPSARRIRRIAEAAGLGVERVSGIAKSQFAVYGTGDAGITSTEGNTKVEFSNITGINVVPQLINVWTDVSRQTLLTMTQFESKLRNVLAAKVARREDELLVATITAALSTHSVPTIGGALSADLLLRGAAEVAAGDVAVEPNLVLANPANVHTILGTTVGPGGEASPDFGSFLPRVHGMTVYPTTYVTAGQALVGAFSASSKFVSGLAPTYLVDAVSGIKQNKVTILLEEAVNLAIDEPFGFRRVGT